MTLLRRSSLMGLGFKLRQKKGQVDVRLFKHKKGKGSQEREELEPKTRLGKHEIGRPSEL